VSSKRPGAADWRSWFEQQIVRSSNPWKHAARAIPPTSAKSSRVAGLNCLRSSNSIQAAAENSCADRRGQISVRVEEIGLGGSGELVRVTRDFKRIRESLCRLQAPAGLNRKTIVAAVNS
jgi:hypothetical protein